MLRPLWDEELGNVDDRGDTADEMRLEWRRHLDWLEICVGKVMKWVKVEYPEWNTKQQALRGSS